MRILLICPTWGQECGVADYTRYLAQGFAFNRIQVQVAATPDQLRQELATNAYDLVHLQHEYSLYQRDLVAFVTLIRERGLPLFATMHSVTKDLGPAMQHPILAINCRAILVHSHEARQTLMQAGMPPQQLCVTNQGCRDLTAVFAEPAAVRAELGIPAEAFAIGFFGFAVPHKGIVPLVQAIQQLDGVWGLIQAPGHFGVPGYVAQLHQELGLPPAAAGEVKQVGRVIFSHRHISEELAGQRMHAMDAIMLPYADQGVTSTSAAVRAALAAHRPVVTSRAVYFSDLEHEVYKLDSPSVAAIRSTIEHLRNSPQLREQLAQQARRYSRENGWEVVARRHLDLYRQRGCPLGLTPDLLPTYLQHPDTLYDIPIQRERVNWLRQNVKGLTVELGCANGFVTEYCGAGVGVDINPQRLAVARLLRQGYPFQELNITQPLPFIDGAFDTVLLPEILQDIPWDLVPRTLAESVRIGSQVLMTVPNAGKSGYDQALVENPEHLWYATPEKLQALFSALPGTAFQLSTSPGEDFLYATIQSE